MLDQPLLKIIFEEKPRQVARGRCRVQNISDQFLVPIPLEKIRNLSNTKTPKFPELRTAEMFFFFFFFLKSKPLIITA